MRRKADVSLGMKQCLMCRPANENSFKDGYRRCQYEAGHTGPHETFNGVQDEPWIPKHEAEPQAKIALRSGNYWN